MGGKASLLKISFSLLFITAAFSCGKEQILEISQVEQNGFISERTDEPCFCILTPVSASGVEFGSPWDVFFVDPDHIGPGLPLLRIGGGVGSGRASTVDPLVINGGQNFIAITYRGENLDTEFTLNLFCYKGDQVYPEQQITFTWRDGLQLSPPFGSTRTFSLNIPDCEVGASGEVN